MRIGATVGIVVLILAHHEVASFAIKAHMQPNLTDETSKNDTLIFAHIVSRKNGIEQIELR